MGKRAKKAAPAARQKQVLAKRFKCPFCANGAYLYYLQLFFVSVSSSYLQVMQHGVSGHLSRMCFWILLSR